MAIGAGGFADCATGAGVGAGTLVFSGGGVGALAAGVAIGAFGLIKELAGTRMVVPSAFLTTIIGPCGVSAILTLIILYPNEIAHPSHYKTELRLRYLNLAL